MAERLLIPVRGKVPHHGPVTPEYPVECLLTVLSLNSFNPLPGAGRAAAVGAIRVLPARHRRPSLVPAGMRGPRTVDPDILARVKVALERL